MGTAPPSELELTRCLSLIQELIHHSPNRTRYAMNNALIAAGAYSDPHAQLALRVAEKIGKVEVDHGLTGCKTPAAADYIRKTRERRRKKTGP